MQALRDGYLWSVSCTPSRTCPAPLSRESQTLTHVASSTGDSKSHLYPILQRTLIHTEETLFDPSHPTWATIPCTSTSGTLSK